VYKHRIEYGKLDSDFNEYQPLEMAVCPQRPEVLIDVMEISSKANFGS